MVAESDYIENVIEPVRRAVIIAVNCISVRVGNKSLSRGNSLPDITSDDCGTYDQNDDGSDSSSTSKSVTKPPLLPKQSDLRGLDEAPPLPPKHLKPKIDRFEDLLAHSLSLHSMDWANHHNPIAYPTFETNKPRQSMVRRTQFLNAHGQDHNKSLPSPRGLDTTLTDQSFEYSFDNNSPKSVSKESLSNMSFDEADGSHKITPLNVTSRNWSSKERSNTSSPSIETLSFSSHLSDGQDRRDHPPAIPKKFRNTPHSINSKKSLQGVTPATPSRKLSQYDNVADAESLNLRQMYELRAKNDLKPVSHLQLSKPDSLTHHMAARSSPVFNMKTQTTLNTIRDDIIDIPPPLPPKKRNIMSYMEMFGKSIFPSGDDLFHGFVHSHDLLHNVWQQNFHEYSEYTPTGLLNFPFIDPNHQDVDQQTLHPYMNLQPGAPALPPKRSNFSRSRPGSFRSSGSYEGEHRRIPIVIEDNISRHSQLSDSGSNSSSEIPRLAEITKLPRLTVQIPIQRIENEDSKDEQQEDAEYTLLDDLDVSDQLVYGEQTTPTNNNTTTSNNKSSNSTKSIVGVNGCVELRAGSIDALIVLATQTIKNDFLYQEAFLATYRTFISTELLVQKLVYRFSKFSKLSQMEPPGHVTSLRISRNAFSLLVRVVDGLADVDFSNKPLLEKLTNFITNLVESGELGLARALRSQFILKYEERRARLLPDFDLASLNSVNRRLSLLNFKSLDIAEQMTLLGGCIDFQNTFCPSERRDIVQHFMAT